LENKESTQIPFLKEAISNLATNWFKERNRIFKEKSESFLAGVGARLELESADISETPKNSPADEILSRLEEFLKEPRDEFKARRGAFGNYIKSSIKDKIKLAVREATNQARREMLSYVKSISDCPWNTLKAAVKQQGTFDGRSRRIALRQEFSGAFTAPMASIWSTRILSDVRKQTEIFADFQEATVKSLIDWAKSNNLRNTTRLVDALVEEIKQNKNRLIEVGKESVAELKIEVKATLPDEVQKPIERECKIFVKRGDTEGRGVADRIRDLLRDLVEKVSEEVGPAIENLLFSKFKIVAKEIRDALKEDFDPLDEAVKRLVPKIEILGQHEIQRNQTILSQIDHALKSKPSFDESATSGVS
jgi:hypothetical protein